MRTHEPIRRVPGAPLPAHHPTPCHTLPTANSFYKWQFGGCADLQYGRTVAAWTLGKSTTGFID
jgi:hypothetical protein